MVQKIETGGTSSTSTPRFRFLANRLFDCNEALHITHWAGAESESNAQQDTTIAVTTTKRIKHLLRLVSIPLDLSATLGRLLGLSVVTQFL